MSFFTECATLGLSGDCCPTNNGVYLGCCTTDPAVIESEWIGFMYADHAGKSLFHFILFYFFILINTLRACLISLCYNVFLKLSTKQKRGIKS